MKRENVNLTEGVIWKSLLTFTLPLLLSALLQQLYNTVDLLIVGRFAGKIDMAAIGASGAITVLVVALFMGLSTGASVLVAQHYGAKDRAALSKVVHTNFAIALYGGLVLTIFTVIFTPQFLAWIDTPPEVMGPAVRYMRILFAGLIPVMVYNMGSAVLRSVGDSVRPFNFLAIAAGLNIVLDLIFVGAFKMGAVGAGIATVLAQSVSGILVLLSLLKTTDIYRLRMKRIRFHKETLNHIVAIGLPAAVSGGLISLSNVIIQAQINVFGAQAIAGVAAASRVDGFVFTSLEAFALAITTFVGQNIGAKKPKRLKSGIITALVMTLLFVASVSSILVIFRTPLMKIFTSEKDVIFYGTKMIVILAPFYVIFSVTEVLSGAIRGSGTAVPIMIITLIGMFIIRLGWIFTAMPMYKTIDIICWSYPISWVFTCILTLIYYFKGKWRKNMDVPEAKK
ncbi:MATE family efflux transporter [Aedoeadaptatus acetigenes]|uniref:MATE family efflux transporter n=1 Tax=Aedoeadaptatus acetigenes TaxID=2981723 RepID=UPI0011DD0C1E|nr:MATE family efflux transporter [Aedoeadaptatus acetigenes]MCU6787103.1 MATE family efflux transporter [Aedoeadaptatus acetigenes]